MKKLLLILFFLAYFSVLLNANFFYINAKEYSDPLKPPFEINQQEVIEKTPLEVYSGQIYHIFFHSLILDPNMAFKSSMREGYNNWMTTRSEFKKILDKLYQNNFILIDINSLIDANGSKKELLLPKDKKPLIISIDDVNYYDYMKGCGFADRLITLKNGSVACIKKTKSGEIIDTEGDVMPIVDKFVELHPDFSFQGAKGIVAVTGFQGVFGYRLFDAKGNIIEKDMVKAKQVANALKQNGWQIACHSYSHSNKFKNGSINVQSFTNDLKKWKNIIEPITGKTNIYIPPFGTHFLPSDRRLKVLKENGFNIFCPVSKNMSISYQNNMLISERLNFDGFTMIKYPQRIKKHFFNPVSIIDPQRPKMK